MKILKSSQIREVDLYTIKNEPIESINLMERAAFTITKWISKNISNVKTIKIFAGPGNNGGDGLAIARQLLSFDFNISVYLLKISDNLSEDCKINLDRLLEHKEIIVNEIHNENDFPILDKNDIVVDGLFGSGLTRKLDGLAGKLVKHINNSNSEIIAIDIPSGLFGEDNDINDCQSIIKASYTLSFQLPKLSFILPSNFEFVGNWEILPIGLNKDIINELNSDYYILNKNQIKGKLINRKKFSHKGTYGHVLIVSGSYGKMGASVLAAKASLRTGSGLVTAHIPKIGYQIMQSALPEVMVSIDWSDIIVSKVPDIENYTSIGVGPGIGTKSNTIKALEDLFDKISSPMVIDADALNILSGRKDLIQKIPKNSILTPHPKEFERLVGEIKGDYKRLQVLKEFSVKNQLFVILKGAHTAIACPDGKVFFNNTGNPGMATAGSGDVLTGVILSLLGQGYNSTDAAIIGCCLDYRRQVPSTKCRHWQYADSRVKWWSGC